MGDEPPLLIRRDAERALSLAVAWFVAVPIFALGLLAFLVPYVLRAVRECPRAPCPPGDPVADGAPFIAAAIAFGIASMLGALALRVLIQRRPILAWRLVAAIGLGLVLLAIALGVVTRFASEAIILWAIWPLAPGIFALLAARRSRRSPASS